MQKNVIFKIFLFSLFVCITPSTRADVDVWNYFSSYVGDKWEADNHEYSANNPNNLRLPFEYKVVSVSENSCEIVGTSTGKYKCNLRGEAWKEKNGDVFIKLRGKTKDDIDVMIFGQVCPGLEYRTRIMGDIGITNFTGRGHEYNLDVSVTNVDGEERQYQARRKEEQEQLRNNTIEQLKPWGGDKVLDLINFFLDNKIVSKIDNAYPYGQEYWATNAIKVEIPASTIKKFKIKEGVAIIKMEDKTELEVDPNIGVCFTRGDETGLPGYEIRKHNEVVWVLLDKTDGYDLSIVIYGTTKGGKNGDIFYYSGYIWDQNDKAIYPISGRNAVELINCFITNHNDDPEEVKFISAEIPFKFEGLFI